MAVSGKRRAGARGLGVAGLSLLLAGCAGDLLVVGARHDAPTVELPSSAPRVAGAESAAAREHQKMLQAFGGEYRAPAAQALLAGMVEKLRNASDMPGLQYRLTILNSGLVNAFALPSGHLYVTRGLLALANDASEAASVLAHEMAHVTARHAIERQELESRSVLVSRVRAEVLNNPGAAQLVRDQAQVAIASFSRQQEIDADQIGMRTLARAGYDPYGAQRFLISLGRNAELVERSPEKGTGLDFAATHPNTPDRVQQALLGARQISAAGTVEVERTRWLNALNGMIYGEDSGEGYVRGRSFLHPRLGIAFTAPDGFILENTAQAVLGMTPGATEALRFDSARIPAEQSLETFLLENRIEGLALTDVRALEAQGLPAATALARGTDWTFRIFAIRVGAQVYRLILAARAFSPEVDERFFRRLQLVPQAVAGRGGARAPAAPRRGGGARRRHRGRPRAGDGRDRPAGRSLPRPQRRRRRRVAGAGPALQDHRRLISPARARAPGAGWRRAAFPAPASRSAGCAPWRRRTAGRAIRASPNGR